MDDGGLSEGGRRDGDGLSQGGRRDGDGLSQEGANGSRWDRSDVVHGSQGRDRGGDVDCQGPVPAGEVTALRLTVPRTSFADGPGQQGSRSSRSRPATGYGHVPCRPGASRLRGSLVPTSSLNPGVTFAPEQSGVVCRVTEVCIQAIQYCVPSGQRGTAFGSPMGGIGSTPVFWGRSLERGVRCGPRRASMVFGVPVLQ